MDLVEFLHSNRQRIVADWQSAVRALFPGTDAAMQLAGDARAVPLLEAIGRELSAPIGSGSSEVAATLAGILQEITDFDPVRLTGELHALRTSVLAAWTVQRPHLDADACRDMLRFNQSVDHAVAETAARCKAEAERRRATFLAILGHDLRGPLSAIAMAGHYLEATGLLGEKQAGAVGSINRGAAILKVAVKDLISYARSQLGGGIPLSPEQVDLAGLCRSAVAEVKAAHPECEFIFDGEEGIVASVDQARMLQLVVNLLYNAVQHGTRRIPVGVALRREADTLVLSVTNHGPAIPAQRLPTLFDPFSRASAHAGGDAGSAPLGLGLFIAREIVSAHKGSIGVVSSDGEGTTFAVRLPVG